MAPSSYNKVGRLLRLYVTSWRKLDVTRLEKCLHAVSPEQRFELMSSIRDNNNHTAMHVAAYINDTEVMECLANSLAPAERFFFMKLRNTGFRTAIHYAADKDHSELITAVLKLISADERCELLSIQDKTGSTAIHKAAEKGRDKAISSMLYSITADQQKCLLDIRNNVTIFMDQLKANLDGYHQHASDASTQTTASGEDIELLDQSFVVELHEAKWLEDEQIMEYERIDAPEPVEADAESKVNAENRLADSNTTLNESSCTNTDEDSSDSESPYTDSDYDEFSVPADLEERLSQLCIDNDVTDFLIHQNPEDYTDIVIEGKNVNTISEEKLQMIQGEKELWSRYKISTTDLVDGERICQFMNSQIRGSPLASLSGTCELLVEMEENNNEIVASAVGPAHMMFSKDVNRQLRNGVGLDEARNHIEKTPKHTKYEIHFDQTTLETSHPPMIGYRYKLSGENIQRNATTSDESDDAEVYQPVESPLYVNHSLCRNDMALFRLDYSQAESMHDRLLSHQGRRSKLVDVKRLNQLKKYVRPNPTEQIRIRVKDRRGVLVRHTLSIERQRARGEAYHLMFKLDNDCRELVEGDSGSIVLEETTKGDLRPLGMLTGTVYIPTYSTSYYQAVILSRALEDISASYNLTPPGLQLFNASGRDRTSRGLVRHRSTTEPPAAQFGTR